MQRRFRLAQWRGEPRHIRQPSGMTAPHSPHVDGREALTTWKVPQATVRSPPRSEVLSLVRYRPSWRPRVHKGPLDGARIRARAAPKDRNQALTAKECGQIR